MLLYWRSLACMYAIGASLYEPAEILKVCGYGASPYISDSGPDMAWFSPDILGSVPFAVMCLVIVCILHVPFLSLCICTSKATAFFSVGLQSIHRIYAAMTYPESDTGVSSNSRRWTPDTLYITAHCATSVLISPRSIWVQQQTSELKLQCIGLSMIAI